MFSMSAKNVRYYEAATILLPELREVISGMWGMEACATAMLKFREARTGGIMFLTDRVGEALDFENSNLDVVVHLDCPSNAEIYLRRVHKLKRGRTSLLVLQECQQKFLDRLREHGIVPKTVKINHVDSSPEPTALLERDERLAEMARLAFVRPRTSLFRQSDRAVFDTSSLGD